MTATATQRHLEATSPSWTSAATDALRHLAATLAAGALLGLLVGGVGGRLAMALLAHLNPRLTGLLSDDGFTVGQVTLFGTFNLLLVATFFGALGAVVYVVLRALMIGPRWFQVLSISLGTAVVVGEQLVHTDGVDFTYLDPAWLGIAMFVLIPGLYAGLLTLLAERWRAPDSFFARGPARVAVLPLLTIGPLVATLAAPVAGWLAMELARRRWPRLLAAGPALAWAGRAVLVVVFVVALVRLVDEIAVLT